MFSMCTVQYSETSDDVSLGYGVKNKAGELWCLLEMKPEKRERIPSWFVCDIDVQSSVKAFNSRRALQYSYSSIPKRSSIQRNADTPTYMIVGLQKWSPFQSCGLEIFLTLSFVLLKPIAKYPCIQVFNRHSFLLRYHTQQIQR